MIDGLQPQNQIHIAFKDGQHSLAVQMLDAVQQALILHPHDGGRQQHGILFRLARAQHFEEVGDPLLQDLPVIIQYLPHAAYSGSGVKIGFRHFDLCDHTAADHKITKVFAGLPFGGGKVVLLAHFDRPKGKVVPELGAADVVGDARICKVSIVGIGMRSHVGVASRMFKCLSDEGINIQMISTSEIKTSVVIDEKYMELAVRALHREFDLDQTADTIGR